MKAIETGATAPIAFINAENYKQHNLTVGDGLAGFGAALAQLPNFPEAAKVNTVRAFEDGDYVILQTEYNFFGAKAGFDIFRFEDGKIVEHWDNLMPYAGEKTLADVPSSMVRPITPTLTRPRRTRRWCATSWPTC